MNSRNDGKAFAIEMAKLGTAFSSGISKERIAFYWEYLKDLSIDALRAGTERLIKSRKYSSMPTIADIRDAALGIDDDVLNIEAERAWNKAVDLAGEMAYPYRSLDREVDDALNRSTLGQAVHIAFGGWRRLNDSQNPEFRDRGYFTEAYKTLKRNERERKLLMTEIKKLRESNHESDETK